MNLHGEYDFTEDVDNLEMLFDIDKILALKVAWDMIATPLRQKLFHSI